MGLLCASSSAWMLALVGCVALLIWTSLPDRVQIVQPSFVRAIDYPGWNTTRRG